VASAHTQGVLLSLLAATLFSGCSDDTSSPPPLQAIASSSVACKTGQGYQHTTLGYHLCFPEGWTSRDYTSEPGGGGASGSSIPPVVVRVVGGPKAQAESSLVKGNQVTRTTVAGIAADRIVVTDSGPANGAVIIVLEHQANSFEIEEAPGGTYDQAFQLVLDSFSFPTS